VSAARSPTANDTAVQAPSKARPKRLLFLAQLLGYPLLGYLVLSWILGAMLFHPSPDEAREVERIGERVSYRASDGTRLSSWLVRSRTPRRRTLVYFHGNAATASDCWGWARVLSDHGTDVLLAEYRGYGQSEGRPSAAGIELDAAAAVRFLLEEQHVPLSELVVHGQSLGGAAALSVLAGPARDAAGGIVESSFTSLHDMARQVVGLPLTYLVPDAYHLDSASRASQVRAPILQIHGDRDEVIPYALGERLRDALSPRRFVRVPGGTHNLLDVDEEVVRFLEEVAP